MPTTLTFIGNASCTPDADNDTACFLLNSHVLIDCGWCAALSLLRRPDEPDATGISHVLLTHCHHDHYMGLASVLFYRAMNKARIQGDPELVIGGPANDIARVAALAQAFLQVERFPTVHAPHRVMPITPGESFRIGELDVRTARTRHPVQGLAYRFLDMDTGASIGITGDTGYLPELAEFFSGVDSLVTEASMGAADAAAGSTSGHSSARDAARLARAAGASGLALVHYRAEDRADVKAAAREIFPGAYLPAPGERLTLDDRYESYDEAERDWGWLDDYQ